MLPSPLTCSGDWALVLVLAVACAHAVPATATPAAATTMATISLLVLFMTPPLLSSSRPDHQAGIPADPEVIAPAPLPYRRYPRDPSAPDLSPAQRLAMVTGDRLPHERLCGARRKRQQPGRPRHQHRHQHQPVTQPRPRRRRTSPHRTLLSRPFHRPYRTAPARSARRGLSGVPRNRRGGDRHRHHRSTATGAASGGVRTLPFGTALVLCGTPPLVTDLRPWTARRDPGQLPSR